MLAAGLGWGAAAQCDAGDELRRVLGVKGLEVERGASATVELVDALAHRRRPLPGLIVPVSPLYEVLDVFTRDEATHIDDDATTLKTSGARRVRRGAAARAGRVAAGAAGIEVDACSVDAQRRVSSARQRSS